MESKGPPSLQGTSVLTLLSPLGETSVIVGKTEIQSHQQPSLLTKLELCISNDFNSLLHRPRAFCRLHVPKHSEALSQGQPE